MKTILVIEDNKDIRENTAEILELAGYKVFTAEHGKKGVELALNDKPDLVICDIMMPELDGYGVLHLLRKNESTQYTPFIFLTAKAERTDFRKGMEMGADDYITKPFDDIELLNAIEVRLKKSAVLEARYESTAQGIGNFVRDAKNAGLIDSLAEQFTTAFYGKKQMIYSEGKRPRFLYCILSGKVKVYKTHEEGKEYITEIAGAGDFIGYTALIEERNYDDHAVVLEDAEILQVPREDFLNMVFGNLQVAGRFIQLITRNVKEKEERLLGLAYSSLRKRVAAALLQIHGKFNEAGHTEKTLDVSRDDIARYVGTATESLIRTLSDFRAEKLIEIHEGKIRISGTEKLKNMAY